MAKKAPTPTDPTDDLVGEVLDHCCGDETHDHDGPRAVGAAAGSGEGLRKLVAFIVKLLQAYLDRQPA